MKQVEGFITADISAPIIAALSQSELELLREAIGDLVTSRAALVATRPLNTQVWAMRVQQLKGALRMQDDLAALRMPK